MKHYHAELKSYITDKNTQYFKVKNYFMQLDIQSETDFYNTIVEKNPTVMGKRMNILQAEQLFNRFVLLGDSGSGKTTALKYLCCRKLQVLLKEVLLKTSSFTKKIPVFIDLSMFENGSKKSWIFEAVKNELYPYLRKSPAIISYLLQEGAFLLIFDGLNEVPKNLLRKAIQEIEELLAKYPRNNVIISTRTMEYHGYFNLKTLSVKKLDLKKVNLFLESKLHDKEIKYLHNKIFDHESESLKELLTIPFFLTLYIKLLNTSIGNGDINKSKIIDYFIDEWFNMESRKRKLTLLPGEREVFKMILSELAYLIHLKGEVQTSKEYIITKMAKIIKKYEEDKFIPESKFSSSKLFNEFYSSEILKESNGLVGFYHSIFKEYFAGRYFTHLSPHEIVETAESFWWKEPLYYHASFCVDPESVIHKLIENGRVFDAALFLSSGVKLKRDTYDRIIKGLFNKIRDKYSYNSMEAVAFLSNIKDSSFWEKVRDVYEEEEEDKELKQIFHTLLEKQGLMPKVEDSHSSDYRRVLSFKENICKYSDEAQWEELFNFYLSEIDGIEDLYIIEEQIIELYSQYEEEFFNFIIKNINNSNKEINKRFLSLWSLNLISGKGIADLLFMHMQPDNLSSLILNIFKSSSSEFSEEYIVSNIAVDYRIKPIFRTLLGFIELKKIERCDVFFNCVHKIIEGKIDEEDYMKQIFSFYLELDRLKSEMFFLEIIREKEFYAEIVTSVLKSYGVSDKNMGEFINLFGSLNLETRKALPVILSNNINSPGMRELENICMNESEDLAVRVNSIGALGKVGSRRHLILLRGLSTGKDPRIYNPAYDAYITIKKKLDFEEGYISPLSIDEESSEAGEFDEILNGKPVYDVKIFRDSPEIVKIEEVIVNLGPVCGFIFCLLARNAIFKKPYTIDYIARKLEEANLYISRDRIKDRIKDIRNKIHETLSGRINEYKLVENIRKYGYKVNAIVEII